MSRLIERNMTEEDFRRLFFPRLYLRKEICDGLSFSTANLNFVPLLQLSLVLAYIAQFATLDMQQLVVAKCGCVVIKLHNL